MTAPYQPITYWCVRCGKQIGAVDGCHCPPAIQPPPLPQYGWICPKCGRGNAPFKMSCDCTAITIYGNTYTTAPGGTENA
jgi:hypothetical protein